MSCLRHLILDSKSNICQDRLGTNMRENSEQNAVCAFFSQVSLEAAQQSVVLLKNDGLLPLKTGASQPFKTIAAVRKTPF